MFFRVLSVLIGFFMFGGAILLFVLAMSGRADFSLHMLAGAAIGVVLLGYGFGGQKFLKKYFPKLAEKSE